MKKTQFPLTWHSNLDFQFPSLQMWLLLDWMHYFQTLERLLRCGLQFRFRLWLSAGITEDEPLKLLFTGLTKQQYVQWWAAESVVNRSTGGFGALISLRYHLRIDEKMRGQETHSIVRENMALWRTLESKLEPTQYHNISRIYMDLQLCRACQVSKRVIGWVCD